MNIYEGIDTSILINRLSLGIGKNSYNFYAVTWFISYPHRKKAPENQGAFLEFLFMIAELGSIYYLFTHFDAVYSWLK